MRHTNIFIAADAPHQPVNLSATEPALAIMARYPSVGEVKTRLAATIGADRACAFYRAFLRDLEQRFSGHDRTLIWMYHPPGCDFASVVGTGARCLPQVGRGRLLRNVRGVLQSDGAGPAWRSSCDRKGLCRLGQRKLSDLDARDRERNRLARPKFRVESSA